MVRNGICFWKSKVNTTVVFNLSDTQTQNKNVDNVKLSEWNVCVCFNISYTDCNISTRQAYNNTGLFLCPLIARGLEHVI